MANIYLRSTDGSDVDNGSTWALAKATLAGALAIATSADTIWVSQAHAETQASAMTLTCPATPGLKILCGNDAAEPPTALATTATISTTGANSITTTGFADVYGVTFQSGDSTSAGSITLGNPGTPVAGGLLFDSCEMYLRGNNSAGLLSTGTGGSTGHAHMVEFINTSVRFSHAGQSIRARGPLVWRDKTSDAVNSAGTAPTSLFILATGMNGRVPILCSGLDLDFVTGNLFSVGTNGGVDALIRNCKLGSGVALKTGSWNSPQQGRIRVRNSDSADTQDRLAESCYAGDVTHESTIVRTPGASNGIRSISWKMVSTANSRFYAPLYSPEIVVWLTTTGSKTVSVEIVNDGTTFQDDEIWLEVEGLNTTGFPISTRTSDRMTNILSTPANQTTSSDTWDTTGLASPVYQTLSVTFTTAEIGLIRARVCLAEPSKTVYVDPLLVVA